MKLAFTIKKDPCSPQFGHHDRAIRSLRFNVWCPEAKKSIMDTVSSEILKEPLFGAGFVIKNRGVAAWYFGTN